MDGEIDTALADFERFASSLVHLEPRPLDAVRQGVEQFVAVVQRHLDGRATTDGQRSTAAEGAVTLTDRLGLEHERFRASLEGLRGLLAVVVGNDHGGHRQAPGQYGRVLAEALRSHRADGRAVALPRPSRTASRDPPARRASDN
jgi:hypothetical protein